MKFKARITENRKLDVNWELVNQYVSRWQPGTFLDVEITRRVAKKSDPQRRYYWSVVIREYAKHIGYDADELETFHKQLKIIYFNIKPEPVNSETVKAIYKNIPSVFSDESDLDVKQKSEFIEWVIRSAAKDGVYIPDSE